MGQTHPPLVIGPVTLDDPRALQLLPQLSDDPVQLTGDGGCLVVAELDDRAEAWGAYRMVDASTAEIRRMYVAPSARRMKVGAAIVAELEAAARRSGVERLVLETRDRQAPAVTHYERFGFRRRTRPPDVAGSSTTIVLEKSLTAEPGRLA